MVQKQEEMNECGGGSSKVETSSSSSSVSSPPLEQGRKNKRKLAEPSQRNAASLTEFPRYEVYPKKSQSLSCDNDSIGNLKSEELDGWDDPFACHLEELLSLNLFTLFRTAMNQIVDCGYSEDVVLKAISCSRLYCGGNDLVSNIVNDTLSFLKSGKKVSGLRDYVFEDLQQLVAYTLVEKINLVREVRPSLSTVEAMWRLLMCDLNVLQASEVDGDGIEGAGSSSVSNQSKPSETPKSDESPQVSNQNEPVKFGSFPDLQNSKTPQATTQGKEVFSATTTTNAASGEGSNKSLTSVSDEKSVSCRKNRTKKEIAMLRQESCVKKMRNYSKPGGGSYKAGKFASVGGFLVEKRGKPSSSSSSSSSSKITSAEVVKAPLPESKSETEKKASSVQDYYAGIPFDESHGIYVPRNQRDELIIKLVPRMKDIEKELQGWTDWANQKVKQATSRLLKDQPELKALRKEKEEAEDFRREKQLLEENTMKRRSEMELALNKTMNQLEKANITVRRLEMEQSLLKKEREAANRRAVETAENCKEQKERVQRSLKDSQSWEGQKVLLQEELKVQKEKVAEMQHEVAKAENRHNQIEATWNQEKAAKARLIAQAAALKKETEQIEESGKAEEEQIKTKAEEDVKFYIDNIKRLESEVSKLKLESDHARIAALKNSNNIEGTTTNTWVKRDRECVMCLSEEMSVIFLPCAHQVLCTKCNELHEKEGMEDCPSCRAKIQRRIQARFARGG